jgi:hypothetical protein
LRSHHLTTLLLAVSCISALPACFPGHGGRGVVISSEKSDYSPVMSLMAQVRVSDSVRVSVSRVTLLAPGSVYEGMGAITGTLNMQALLVTAVPNANVAGNNDRTRNGVNKPWMERSASQSIPVADSLHMGIPRSLRDLHFALPLAARIDLKGSWLVFRIYGATVSSAIHMADGTVFPAKVDENGIRVFACATQNLNGVMDKVRAEQLKTAYNEWC